MKVQIMVAAMIVSIGLGAFHGTESVSAQQVKSQWTGIYTPSQAKRGAPVYAFNCAPCHGENLEGTEVAPALVAVALGKWNEKPLKELFDYIHVAMPIFNPGGLSPQLNADILAFMLFKTDAPAGQTELPAGGDALKQIIFRALKP